MVIGIPKDILGFKGQRVKQLVDTDYLVTHEGFIHVRRECEEK